MNTDAAEVVIRQLKQGPATNKDLQEETGIGRRSLYRVLRALMDIGRVEMRPSLRDARRSYYVLNE